jgi:hypothetical protein
MAKIWTEILRLDRVELEDDFFESPSVGGLSAKVVTLNGVQIPY